MFSNEIPCLSLAIARLQAIDSDNFAIWVIESPLPGGYVHYDCIWPVNLTCQWIAWQEVFSPQDEAHIPVLHPPDSLVPISSLISVGTQGGYGGQLMQKLGISLWQWCFHGPIRQSLAQSQGIAIGKNQSLRIRLEIRDSSLITLPWEIMQPESGIQSISLSPQILFSRTTTNVDPLPIPVTREGLNILLVLGEDENHAILNSQSSLNPPHLSTQPGFNSTDYKERLQLEIEANTLRELITQSNSSHGSNALVSSVSVQVHTLIQPTASELIEALDQGNYNVFFYAGHGMPGPDGGFLFLRNNAIINGTELAQVLVRNQVILALFNACWGAQPLQKGRIILERSSLAEVLIHHGVPAVLAMRDSIADQEALSFIQAFTRALTQKMPIDQAVRIARQQLLTLYGFNQPAWTLPILYMHPQFNGQIIDKVGEGVTELPVTQLDLSQESFPAAYMRPLDKKEQLSQIYGGLMRVGRHQENDLVIQERWVSQRHAEIICREMPSISDSQYTYYLRDFSRFGTFIYKANTWHKIHHQEVPLDSEIQLKFGSLTGQAYEFIID